MSEIPLSCRLAYCETCKESWCMVEDYACACIRERWWTAERLEGGRLLLRVPGCEQILDADAEAKLRKALGDL